MKKFLLSALLAVAACCGAQASATVTLTATNVEQPAGDTLLFALPVDVNVYQDIQNYPEDDPGSRMMKFQPEYLVTARDFTQGDVTLGTAELPAFAKVIGLGLDGYDVASDPTSHGIYLEVTAWCRNVPATKLSLDNLDLLDGYGYNAPVGDLFTDTVNCRGYWNHPGYICTFDPEATAQNPGSIVDVPFNNPDADGNNVPFVYAGENIYLTLWMCNWDDVHMKYRYMAYDQAEARIASLMRSSHYCFNGDTYDVLLEYFGTQLMYELPDHRLPAFRTPYFTSDVRVTFTDQDGIIELRDADGNVYTVGEDGNFHSLDHTRTYTVLVDGAECGEIAFEDLYKDIDLVVNKKHTAVEEIAAGKTVASVAYYNLAGQQSSQPVDGVNIIVTTYTDGTRSTAKVVK